MKGHNKGFRQLLEGPVYKTGSRGTLNHVVWG